MTYKDTASYGSWPPWVAYLYLYWLPKLSVCFVFMFCDTAHIKAGRVRYIHRNTHTHTHRNADVWRRQHVRCTHITHHATLAHTTHTRTLTREKMSHLTQHADTTHSYALKCEVTTEIMYTLYHTQTHHTHTHDNTWGHTPHTTHTHTHTHTHHSHTRTNMWGHKTEIMYTLYQVIQLTNRCHPIAFSLSSSLPIIVAIL